MCPLDSFIQLYETKLPDNMDEECQSNRIRRKILLNLIESLLEFLLF